MTTEPIIDKSAWADGPWKTEPDRVEFEHAGHPCLMVRHPRGGHWCGYVAVPPGHPWYEKGEDIDASVHGGVTYSDHCADRVCHVPKPGEPDNVWWLGFDFCHAGDHSPGFAYQYVEAGENFRKLFGDEMKWPASLHRGADTYKDQAYVAAECRHLADQAAKAGK